MFENNNDYNQLVNDIQLNDIRDDDDDDINSVRDHFRDRDIDQSVDLYTANKTNFESMDFEEVESVMWRKHQLRRFFQDRGHWWTSAKQTTAWKWILVILIGMLVGCTGVFVAVVTEALIEWKYHIAEKYIDEGKWAGSFFVYVVISLLFGIISALLCFIVPNAAGSGIPEIKAFLNGVGIRQYVRVKVLIVKAIGVCFSVASGLPVGKEGPMIHIGAIMGAAVSQGKTITFGFDTSWTKFQDFRNDRAKRDFVTYGAAAGVAAAFRAPIGGVLFTLEEGASFWSTSITFRAFFCAMVAMLAVSILVAGRNFGREESSSTFAFGQFDNLTDGKNNFYTYEIPIFALMGCAGGVLGATFNHINLIVARYRSENLKNQRWKRMVEVCVYVVAMAVISFILPLMWQECTNIPSDTSEWTSQQRELLDDLVHFQCDESKYNQLASLYFAPPDTALRQLFHFREYDGSNYTTFGTGSLLLFFVPYFCMAAVSSGSFCPTGLFVPGIIAGAAFGRLCGHLMNNAFPGYVADAGTYALIGSAAMLGGIARMTISGTVIMLEAAGNTMYLLPLMVTFGGARYAGNALNHGIYELLIDLQNLPFLPGSLQMNKFGLLTYFPVAEIMATPVVVFNQVTKVSRVYQILSTTKHNGFPVIGKNGHLVGLIMRKTLCTLLKLKAYSVPQQDRTSEFRDHRFTSVSTDGGMGKSSTAGSDVEAASSTSSKGTVLAPAATVFHDTLERTYPRYPAVDDIKLTQEEMNFWLDLRPYMDTAPYSINQSASVQRCYRQFRTMGLRHMVVVDSDHLVVGMVTRKDITEHKLEAHWDREGHNLQKFINVDAIPPAVIHPKKTSSSDPSSNFKLGIPPPLLSQQQSVASEEEEGDVAV